jgi:putative hydrolase of the HAD superfamily
VLFSDALPALARIATRYPLIGLTNGNADWHSIGLSPYFNRGVLAAREFGQGKPHAAFFHEACKRLDLPPAQVLHGGDDWHLDVEGALDAGLQAVWLRHTELPPAKFSAPRRVAQADSLLALCDLLGC